MATQEVPFNALSEASREHLVACMSGQSTPKPLLDSTSSPTTDLIQWALLALVGLGVAASGMYWVYDDSALTLITWGMVLVGTALAGWATFGILRRLLIARNLPYRPGNYLFPLHIVRADGPVLTIHPLNDIEEFHGTHQHKNNAYQHTTFVFSFEDGTKLTLIENNKQRAERILQQVQLAGQMANEAARNNDMSVFEQLDPLFGARSSGAWASLQMAPDTTPSQGPAARKTRGPIAQPLITGGIAGLVLGGLVGAGYDLANDEMAYQSAKADHVTYRYERYLREFARLHADEVRDVLLPSAAFDEAVERHTVTHLRTFRERYPNSAHDADALAAIHALYAGALAKVHEGVNDPALDGTMSDLFAWLEAHPEASVEVRFRAPDTQQLSDFDGTLQTMGEEVYGIPIAPASPSFNAQRSGTREKDIANNLEKGFAEVVPNDILALQHGPRLAPDAIASDSTPTLEVSYTLAPSGSMFTGEGEDRGYVGITVDFDVALRVPGHEPYSFELTVEPPNHFTVTTYGDDNVDPSDSVVYDTMARNAFGRLKGQLSHTMLGTELPVEAEPPKDDLQDRLRKLREQLEQNGLDLGDLGGQQSR